MASKLNPYGQYQIRQFDLMRELSIDKILFNILLSYAEALFSENICEKNL